MNLRVLQAIPENNHERHEIQSRILKRTFKLSTSRGERSWRPQTFGGCFFFLLLQTKYQQRLRWKVWERLCEAAELWLSQNHLGLQACTFTITHPGCLLLGTRNLLKEPDSVWNHRKSFNVRAPFAFGEACFRYWYCWLWFSLTPQSPPYIDRRRCETFTLKQVVWKPRRLWFHSGREKCTNRHVKSH